MNTSKNYAEEVAIGGGIQYVNTSLLDETEASSSPLFSGDSVRGSKGMQSPCLMPTNLKGKGGTPPSPSNFGLSGNGIELDKSDSDLDSDHLQRTEFVYKSAIALQEMKKAKAIAQKEAQKDQRRKYDPIAIEYNLLSTWICDNDLSIFELDTIKAFALWKQETNLEVPSYSTGKLGWLIAAIAQIRKVGGLWERLIVRDEIGEWISIDESFLLGFCAGFAGGIGMSEHLSSLSLCNKTLNNYKKQVECLSWDSMHDPTASLDQWLRYHVHPADVHASAVSSAELWQAYTHTGGKRHTQRAFAMALTKAITRAFPDQMRQGSIQKSENITFTDIQASVPRCRGWLGLRIIDETLRDKIRLKFT